MVPLALEILAKNPYALGGIRHTYSHVFLDEFQDATTEQYELLLAAFGESATLLTAVGDTKQRIMVFAGALDGIMRPSRQTSTPSTSRSIRTADPSPRCGACRIA